MRHLGTAAFIVSSYRTGMRPGEVLGPRSGCCPDPEPDASGQVGRHLIRSVEYKSATDDRGNHLSAGIERDVPWVAITPVIRAIRVLERMVPEDALLFDHRVHDPLPTAIASSQPAGTVKGISTVDWLPSLAVALVRNVVVPLPMALQTSSLTHPPVRLAGTPVWDWTPRSWV